MILWSSFVENSITNPTILYEVKTELERRSYDQNGKTEKNGKPVPRESWPHCRWHCQNGKVVRQSRENTQPDDKDGISAIFFISSYLSHFSFVSLDSNYVIHDRSISTSLQQEISSNWWLENLYIGCLFIFSASKPSNHHFWFKLYSLYDLLIPIDNSKFKLESDCK